MIQTVIKRDGRKEPFNPQKCNDWIKWASADIQEHVDWSSIVLKTIRTLPEEVTAKQLQDGMIRTCLDMNSYGYNKMAGRLYSQALKKEIFSWNKREYPHIKDLHERMIKAGVIVKPNYTDEEYDAINAMLEHSLDMKAAHYSLNQIVEKYAIKNKETKTAFETPQYTIMRVCMEALNDYKESDRLEKLKELYFFISHKKINVPTPMYANALTKNKSGASCALVKADDTASSIGIANTLGYSLTTSGAGLGLNINCRSIGAPVRGGVIKHSGKVPYYKMFGSTIKSSMQGSRGGSATVYYPFTDPELFDLLILKNPMTPTSKRLRELDYGVVVNKWLFQRAAKKQDIYLFDSSDAPDLYEAIYTDTPEVFEEKMMKFASEHPDKVKAIPALDVLKAIMKERMETGRVYLFFADEANHHTSYKDVMYSSNLCNETINPTKGYKSYADLYRTDDGDDLGYVGFCNLSGVVADNITSDEEYAKAAYYALFLIDSFVENTVLEFPHLTKSIKAWRSAGVGVLGLAHLMARNKLSYASQEGKNFIHELMETHVYHLHEAALQLAKERGNCEYIHRSKYPEGWLPIDTYNKNVDELVTVGLKRDWEDLRKRMIEQGGLRFTSLCLIPPAETSSQVCETVNAVYPIREGSIVKVSGDVTNNWVAPEYEILKDYYDIAWEVPTKDMIHCYAIMQKFIDMGISCDFWIDRSKNRDVSTKQLIQELFWCNKYGLKGNYYYNTKMDADVVAGAIANTTFEDEEKQSREEQQDEPGCDSGGCTL